MPDHDYRCGKCDKPFRTLSEGLKHVQKVHGATRQDAQNERKLRIRKR